jgi:hypothetical protein
VLDRVWINSASAVNQHWINPDRNVVFRGLSPGIVANELHQGL